MANCMNCGKPLAANAANCVFCGEPAKALTQANVENEENPGKLYKLAKELSSQKDYESAVKLLTRAIDIMEQRPDCPPSKLGVVYGDRSTAYFRLEDYQKALPDIKKALGLNPESAVSWSNAGNIYLKMEDEKRAAEHYVESARCYLQNNEPQNALVKCQKALELDPENALAKKQQVKAQKGKATAEEASSWFEKGEEHIREDRYGEAIAAFTECIKLDDTYPEVWIKRGLANLLDEDQENYDAALADFDRAIEIDAEAGEAYAYRADVHWRSGRKDEALADMQKAFELNGDGWPTTASAMFHNGAQLPEEIIEALRDEGYLEDDE